MDAMVKPVKPWHDDNVWMWRGEPRMLDTSMSVAVTEWMPWSSLVKPWHDEKLEA
jgi:hypothetical protein